MKRENKKSIHHAKIEGYDDYSAQPEASAGYHVGIGLKNVVAILIAATILGTITVTAAANELFGLTTEKTGKYGLNVKVDNGSEESEFRRFNLKFGYMPERYTADESGSSWYSYTNGDEYFRAMLLYGDNDEYELTNVIETSETEYDGNKTVFITFKEAENTDLLFYQSMKYFDEEHYLVRCSCSDLDELVKITEQISLEPAPADHLPDDYLEDPYDYNYDGAIMDYYRNGCGFRDEYFSGSVKEVKTGESMEFATSDDNEETVMVKAKLTSVEERYNADGLDKNDFIFLGKGSTTFGMFFKGNGDLDREERVTNYIGADENHLGTAVQGTDIKHFYLANIELTAEEDISDLHRVLTTDVQIIDKANRTYYGFMDKDNDRVLVICESCNNRKLSLKKGETTYIQVGIVTTCTVPDETGTEKNMLENAYLTFSAIDEKNYKFQNCMVRLG